LLIAASMLIHSSIHALNVDTGYDIKHVIGVDAPDDGKPNSAQKETALISELRKRLAGLPGVVSITNAAAPFYGFNQAAYSDNGEIPSARNKQGAIDYSYVEPNYFQTLGIPLLVGHTFPLQAGKADASVILSETAAKQLWPGQNPIGRTLRLGTDGFSHRKGQLVPDGPLYQVIGVVGDTRGATFDDSDTKLVYLRLPEDRLRDYSILIRTRSDPSQVMPEIFPVISSYD